MDTAGHSCSTVPLPIIDIGHSYVFVFMIFLNFFFPPSIVAFKIARQKKGSLIAELLSVLVHQVRRRSALTFPTVRCTRQLAQWVLFILPLTVELYYPFRVDEAAQG